MVGVIVLVIGGLIVTIVGALWMLRKTQNKK
jgi:hypothetical protein